MLKPTLAFSAASRADQPIATDMLADWIEARVLFDVADRVSFPDVVEFLVSEQYCDNQDAAWFVVADLKRALRKRSRNLRSGYPFLIEDMSMRRLKRWQDVSEYSFCLLLSLSRLYPILYREQGSDYTEQGELFEILTLYSLRRILTGWVMYVTGWSRSTTAGIVETVKYVSRKLGEPHGDILRWVRRNAKDAGLDILCYRSFEDSRGGIPIFLVQCASGKNWERKLSTPDLNVWGNLVQFSSRPKRAFASPFHIVEEEFSMHAGRVQGLVLDRYRLLEPLRTGERFLSRAYSARINRWCRPRVRGLPWVY